jgi:adenylate kinase family enzyme
MEVTLLIGGSGTGKSYQAMRLAKMRGINYIIDDGLFIHNHQILGGKSAKRAPSRLGAIRRAIFLDEQHREQVKKLIQKEKPEKLLILGTSQKMMETIVAQLELEGPVEIVLIEEITGVDEIKLAQRIRKQEGKHVIPVPAFELKKDFSGYFLNPLKSLKQFGKDDDDNELPEKSVVRPTFSYLGKFTISDGVIRSLVNDAVSRYTNLIPAGRTFVQNSRRGLFIELDVKAPFGIRLTQQLKTAQMQICKEVERMTSLHIASVNITVKKWME